MEITFTPSERDVNLKGLFCPDCGERVRSIGISKDTRIEKLEVRCKRCRSYKKVSVIPEGECVGVSSVSRKI